MSVSCQHRVSVVRCFTTPTIATGFCVAGQARLWDSFLFKTTPFNNVNVARQVGIQRRTAQVMGAQRPVSFLLIKIYTMLVAQRPVFRPGRGAGYTAACCKVAGYTAAGCKVACCKAACCKIAGCKAAGCKAAGYMTAGCKVAGCKVSQGPYHGVQSFIPVAGTLDGGMWYLQNK